MVRLGRVLFFVTPSLLFWGLHGDDASVAHVVLAGRVLFGCSDFDGLESLHWRNFPQLFP